MSGKPPAYGVPELCHRPSDLVVLLAPVHGGGGRAPDSGGGGGGGGRRHAALYATMA